MKRLSSIAAMGGLLLALACAQHQGKTEVRSQMETAQRIAKLEQEIDANQAEVNALTTQYVQAGGKDLGSVLGQGLSPEQTALLEQRLKNEQGIGYKDLISDILTKQKAADDLKVQVQNLERTLPAPVDVVKGERHIDIAMAYLTKDQGLDPATAKSLVQKVNLMDELVPGFKVWNFYHDGVYGTFVTQGDAKVSPYGVIQHAKKVLVDEKNSAIAQRDALAKEKANLTQQVADLTSKREQLTQEVSLLQTERASLTQKVSDLDTLSKNLQSKVNSVFYRIGPRKALIKEGLVRDPWYARPQLIQFAETDYPQQLDLRSDNTISFSAKDADVARIKKVRIAPGALYKPGVDYRVSVQPDGTKATVTLLNRDKFRAERSMMVLVN